MFKINSLIAAAALTAPIASFVAAPALATPPQTTANLVNGNSGILVEAYGDGSAQVVEVILITPDGNEVYAQGVTTSTNTETRTTTHNNGGYNNQPTGTLSLGTGYTTYNGHGHGHGGSYNSVGLGFGIPLTFGGSGSGSSTTTQSVTTTTSEALIQLPQPMHYLQLWQDYRIEVVYRENGVEKVVTVPTPRPRGANS